MDAYCTSERKENEHCCLGNERINQLLYVIQKMKMVVVENDDTLEE